MPVALISGDDVTCAENRPLFPQAEFIEVKQAYGQRAARNLSVVRARARLRDGAEAAARRVYAPPARPEGPFHVAFTFSRPVLADQAALLPPAIRHSPVQVGFDCISMADVINWMTSLSALSLALR